MLYIIISTQTDYCLLIIQKIGKAIKYAPLMTLRTLHPACTCTLLEKFTKHNFLITRDEEYNPVTHISSIKCEKLI